jgi:NitT/TauT family transport system substrate-binding protein
MNRRSALQLGVAGMAAGVFQASPASGNEPLAASVGVLSNDNSLEPVYADSAGFFRRAGLSVQVQPFVNGGAIVAAVGSGALNIGFSNLVSIIGAIQHGLPIIFLAPAAVHSSRSPTTVLAQALSSNYHSGAELRGKIVGLDTLHSLTQIGVSEWVQKTGGEISSIHFIELPFSEVGAALERGRVDAAVTSEPFRTAQRSQLKVLADVYSAIAETFLIGAFVTSRTWLEGNAEAAHAFVTSIRETARWANQHQAQTAEILVKRSKIEPRIANTMVRSVYAEQLIPQLLQPVIDAAANFGFLQSVAATDLLNSPPNN